MAGANLPVIIQDTITLTGALVIALNDLGMGHADQVILFIEYVNVDADSMEYQVQTASKKQTIPTIPLVTADFYNETMEDEDKTLGIGKTVNKERQFVRPTVATTYRFTNIIPVSEDVLRVSFKETLGAGASFGTIKITALANYLGRP